eukprot:CAMPEP_0184969278 /NCGR_PEP_ID=MMETSP1098-20130426/2057_1 /TAXON_ID=89044 /ORGANISM="Spumella elongata, Strain CCAP 955/1" /LENGTH=38 /DNA_ID= /DNA_START= /DNA_END= /DNA_ORIENTATION=
MEPNPAGAEAGAGASCFVTGAKTSESSGSIKLVGVISL